MNCSQNPIRGVEVDREIDFTNQAEELSFSSETDDSVLFVGTHTAPTDVQGPRAAGAARRDVCLA